MSQGEGQGPCGTTGVHGGSGGVVVPGDGVEEARDGGKQDELANQNSGVDKIHHKPTASPIPEPSCARGPAPDDWQGYSNFGGGMCVMMV